MYTVLSKIFRIVFFAFRKWFSSWNYAELWIEQHIYKSIFARNVYGSPYVYYLHLHVSYNGGLIKYDFFIKFKFMTFSVLLCVGKWINYSFFWPGIVDVEYYLIFPENIGYNRKVILSIVFFCTADRLKLHRIIQ